MGNLRNICKIKCLDIEHYFFTVAPQYSLAVGLKARLHYETRLNSTVLADKDLVPKTELS